MELNPEHPVTRAVHDDWHKIVALLIFKMKTTHVEITTQEIVAFAAGDLKAVVLNADNDKISLDLVTMDKGEKLASRHKN